MSLYERIDRYATPRSKDNLEYVAVYTVCFCMHLLPVAVRRLNPWSARRGGEPSIFSETKSLAASCASSSFMGM